MFEKMDSEKEPSPTPEWVPEPLPDNYIEDLGVFVESDKYLNYAIGRERIHDIDARTSRLHENMETACSNNAFADYIMKSIFRKDEELPQTDKKESVTKREAPNGSVGWSPSNYVEEVEASTNGNQESIENRNPASALAPAQAPAMHLSPQKITLTRASFEVVLALHSFDASSSKELSFKKGERLEIVDHPTHDPDWWLARNANGTSGLVPRNFFEVVNDSSSSKAPHQDFAPQYSGKEDLPMERWYFGQISRDRAEDLLQHGRVGEFLVRSSESNPGDLIISMKGIERNKHFKIQNVDGLLKVGGLLKSGNKKFANMNALIIHYTSNPIFSSPTEKLYLTGPLPK